MNGQPVQGTKFARAGVEDLLGWETGCSAEPSGAVGPLSGLSSPAGWAVDSESDQSRRSEI